MLARKKEKDYNYTFLIVTFLRKKKKFFDRNEKVGAIYSLHISITVLVFRYILIDTMCL